MSVEAIIALLGLANSLISVVENEREILKQNGEWSDEQEAAYSKARTDAGNDPDMQPEGVIIPPSPDPLTAPPAITPGSLQN